MSLLTCLQSSQLNNTWDEAQKTEHCSSLFQKWPSRAITDKLSEQYEMFVKCMARAAVPQ